MAAPTYNQDMTTIYLCESGASCGQWGSGNVSLGSGPDFSMEGVNAVDGKISSVEKGIHFNNGTPLAIPSGDHVYTWIFLATPGLADSIQNRGLSVTMGGSNLADFVQWHVEGNDTYGAAGRVGKCYPVDPSVRSANTGSSPYRTVNGTAVTGGFDRFGAIANITATVRGSNLAIDGIRYGTGGFLKDGELIANGDASDNPCTFTGFGTYNDYNDATNGYNRFGIFSQVSGSYELQGKLVLGQDNTGTAAKINFQDADVNIVIPENPHVASTFNEFLLDHASSLINWTNIGITALGTTSPGDITVTSNNPEFNWTGGTITGLGAIVTRSNTIVSGVTIRGCGQITSNSADWTDILVDKSTAAISMEVATLAEINSGHFISDGSNHAVQLTGAAGSYTWNCTTAAYDTGSTGNGVQVTGGSITGNETIHITATTGTFTINVASGATTPSVSTAGAIVNVVVGQTDFTFTLNPAITGYEWRIYEDSATGGVIGTVELDGEESATLSSQTYTYTHSVDTDIVVQIIADGYEELLHYDTLTSADKSVTLNLQIEENT